MTEPTVQRLPVRALGIALNPLHLALCLHRVLPRPPMNARAIWSITPRKLDELLELLLASRPDAKEPWLTISFDDGYLDAAEYVATRATRFPQISFLFFVCPEKTESGAGFRWDLRAPLPGSRALLDAEVDLESENAREDLLRVGLDRETGLASLSAVRALTSFPNVTLGNHTNTHTPATKLSLENARTEYARSHSCFERLFGPETHFAFPYGTPLISFDQRHVELQREFGDAVLWSTEPRPFYGTERGPGAVLPRLAIDGRMSLRELAAWIAKRALVYRATGRRFHCPTPQRDGIAAAAEAEAEPAAINAS